MKATKRKTEDHVSSHERAFFGPVAGLLAAALLLPIAFALALGFVAGWRLEFVQTGSMVPTYPIGSLLVASPIDASEVESGMVVTFQDPNPGREGTLTTHRIIRVKRDQRGNVSFITKGDANNDRDTYPVPAENIRARIRWGIPKLGDLLWSLRGPWGLVVFIGIPFVLFAMSELLARRKARRGGGAAVDLVDCRCLACDAAIAAIDRYCRACGTRQGAPVPASRRPRVGRPLATVPVGSSGRQEAPLVAATSNGSSN